MVSSPNVSLEKERKEKHLSWNWEERPKDVGVGTAEFNDGGSLGSISVSKGPSDWESVASPVPSGPWILLYSGE